MTTMHVMVGNAKRIPVRIAPLVRDVLDKLESGVLSEDEFKKFAKRENPFTTFDMRRFFDRALQKARQAANTAEAENDVYFYAKAWAEVAEVEENQVRLEHVRDGCRERRSSVHQRALAFATIAKASKDMADVDEALMFRKEQEVQNEQDEMKLVTADVLKKVAVALIGMGEIGPAESLIPQALQESAYVGDAIRTMAVVAHVAAGNLEKAKELCEQFQEDKHHYPLIAEARIAIGKAANDPAELEYARIRIENMEDPYERHVSLYALLADATENEDDIARALNTVLSMMSDESRSYKIDEAPITLARLLGRLKQFDRARDMAKRVDNPCLRAQTYAIIAMASGDPEDFHAAYKAAKAESEPTYRTTAYVAVAAAAKDALRREIQ